jgi:hypothetical protein
MTDWDQTYLSEFLSLRCAGDVLNVVSPLGTKAHKEITESMAIIKKLKPITLEKPMEYNVIDLCAGNALTSVLAAHLLPVKRALAIDSKIRKREWSKVQRFCYQAISIYDIKPDTVPENTIVISVHPCKGLANRVIDLYNQSAAQHLILMPCCNGAVKNKYSYLCQTLGKYIAWCFQLLEQCSGKTNMSIDEKCISPKNCVITASKES